MNVIPRIRCGHRRCMHTVTTSTACFSANLHCHLPKSKCTRGRHLGPLHEKPPSTLPPPFPWPMGWLFCSKSPTWHFGVIALKTHYLFTHLYTMCNVVMVSQLSCRSTSFCTVPQRWGGAICHMFRLVGARVRAMWVGPDQASHDPIMGKRGC